MLKVKYTLLPLGFLKLWFFILKVFCNKEYTKRMAAAFATLQQPSEVYIILLHYFIIYEIFVKYFSIHSKYEDLMLLYMYQLVFLMYIHIKTCFRDANGKS